MSNTDKRAEWIAKLNADTATRKKALTSLHEARNEGRGTGATDHAIDGLTAAIRENEAAIKENTERIETFQILDARDAKAAEARNQSPVPEPDGRPTNRDSEIRSLIDGRTNAIVEHRALGTGVANLGSETVFKQPSGLVWTAVERSSAILSAAGRLDTGLDESPIGYPKITGSGTGDQEKAEGAVITAADMSTDVVNFGTYGYTGIQVVNNPLLTSAVVDVENVVTSGLGRRLAKAIGPRLVSGNGTTQPQGIVTGAAAGVTAASATAITFDELQNLVHSVDSDIRGLYQCSFIMNDTTVSLLRRSKDSTGQYLWQDSVAAGVPATLFGFPVIVDNNMASAATGTVPVVFGAVRDAYVIRTTSMRVEASRDALWTTDQTSFRAILKLDAKVLDSAAIKKLTML